MSDAEEKSSSSDIPEITERNIRANKLESDLRPHCGGSLTKKNINYVVTRGVSHLRKNKNWAGDEKKETLTDAILALSIDKNGIQTIVINRDDVEDMIEQTYLAVKHFIKKKGCSIWCCASCKGGTL
jgi:hypothetical protein